MKKGKSESVPKITFVSNGVYEGWMVWPCVTSIDGKGWIDWSNPDYIKATEWCKKQNTKMRYSGYDTQENLLIGV